jgi:CRP-like cAMP-binding protein
MLKLSLGGRTPAVHHRLGGTFLFAGLSRRQLKIVDALLHDRHYLSDEVVFDLGEEGQALYILLSGRVAVMHPAQGDRPVAELGPGDFFGEMALLDELPRSAQVRALEPSHVAVLFRGDFEKLMESHAELASRIAMQLARYLGNRLRQMLAAQRPANAS